MICMSKCCVKSVDIAEIYKHVNDCVSSCWYPDWAPDSHMRRGVIHVHIQSRYQDTRGAESWWGCFDSDLLVPLDKM